MRRSARTLRGRDAGTADSPLPAAAHASGATASGTRAAPSRTSRAQSKHRSGSGRSSRGRSGAAEEVPAVVQVAAHSDSEEDGGGCEGGGDAGGVDEGGVDEDGVDEGGGDEGGGPEVDDEIKLKRGQLLAFEADCLPESLEDEDVSQYADERGVVWLKISNVRDHGATILASVVSIEDGEKYNIPLDDALTGAENAVQAKKTAAARKPQQAPKVQILVAPRSAVGGDGKVKAEHVLYCAQVETTTLRNHYQDDTWARSASKFRGNLQAELTGALIPPDGHDVTVKGVCEVTLGRGGKGIVAPYIFSPVISVGGLEDVLKLKEGKLGLLVDFTKCTVPHEWGGTPPTCLITSLGPLPLPPAIAGSHNAPPDAHVGRPPPGAGGREGGRSNGPQAAAHGNGDAAAAVPPLTIKGRKFDHPELKHDAAWQRLQMRATMLLVHLPERQQIMWRALSTRADAAMLGQPYPERERVSATLEMRYDQLVAIMRHLDDHERSCKRLWEGDPFFHAMAPDWRHLPKVGDDVRWSCARARPEMGTLRLYYPAECERERQGQDADVSRGRHEGDRPGAPRCEPPHGRSSEGSGHRRRKGHSSPSSASSSSSSSSEERGRHRKKHSKRSKRSKHSKRSKRSKHSKRRRDDHDDRGMAPKYSYHGPSGRTSAHEQDFGGFEGAEGYYGGDDDFDDDAHQCDRDRDRDSMMNSEEHLGGTESPSGL